MSAGNVVYIADRRNERKRRLFEHGHAVSNDGRDYGHEFCRRCGGATYTGPTVVCPICRAHACTCHNGKRVTLGEYFDLMSEFDGPEGAA